MNDIAWECIEDELNVWLKKYPFEVEDMQAVAQMKQESFNYIRELISLGILDLDSNYELVFDENNGSVTGRLVKTQKP